MRRTTRKIKFYYLTVNEGNIISVFDSVISYINSLPNTERKYNLGDNKFCFLESYQVNGTQSKIIMKSAKHSFRPNLIHRDTVEERENPKRIEEGECEKSHIVTKFTRNAICLILDVHRGGITIRQLVKYLNEFGRNVNIGGILVNFGYEIVVDEDFLAELNNLDRVTCAEVIMDKQILGSDALNYSNRINQVKQNITLTVKAERGGNIIDSVTDIYHRFRGGSERIDRIRIVGRNDENNEVKLSTDFIERQEWIQASINEETGEISSSEVFSEMESVLRGFN